MSDFGKLHTLFSQRIACQWPRPFELHPSACISPIQFFLPVSIITHPSQSHPTSVLEFQPVEPGQFRLNSICTEWQLSSLLCYNYISDIFQLHLKTFSVSWCYNHLRTIWSQIFKTRPSSIPFTLLPGVWHILQICSYHFFLKFFLLPSDIDASQHRFNSSIPSSNPNKSIV